MGRDRMTPQLAKGGYDPAQVTAPRVLSSRDRLGSPSKFLKNIPIFLRMLECCEGFDGDEASTRDEALVANSDVWASPSQIIALLLVGLRVANQSLYRLLN